MNPDRDPDPTDTDSISLLQPVNLVYQIRSLDDTLALRVFSQYVELLAQRRMSTDTDFRGAQISILDRLTAAAQAAN